MNRVTLSDGLVGDHENSRGKPPLQTSATASSSNNHVMAPIAKRVELSHEDASRKPPSMRAKASWNLAGSRRISPHCSDSLAERVHVSNHLIGFTVMTPIQQA